MSKLAPKGMQGLGLVECLMYCAILGILLGKALPAMQELRLRQRIQGLAETVRTDVMLARGESIRLGEAVHVRFNVHATGTCYLLHTGASGACACNSDGLAVCSAEAQSLKLHWIPLELRASVKANVPSMAFSGYRGTVSPTGSIDIAATDRKATIRHVVSLAGRVRSCTPDGSFRRLNACS
ncbi:GspH/FimT family pseudopilin [Paucibacter sp. JuS9]|uniref:GspH/FimT family pseudopilin n=1 Tax=Roseateles TaxID=93681 RepID=UPI002FE5AF8F